MVYLNGGFKGGETLFSKSPDAPRSEGVTIVPTTGLGLFFTHMLLHKGAMVTEGKKYVLRSDVMYSH